MAHKYKAESGRRLTLKVLEKMSSGKSLEDLFSCLFPKRLEDKERRFAFELVHGVLRNREKLDWIVLKLTGKKLSWISPPILDVLRLSLYQILFHDRIPLYAVVNEGVKLAKEVSGQKGGGFVNAILHRFIENKKNILLLLERLLQKELREENFTGCLSVNYSHPKWLIERWLKRYGESNTIALLKWNNQISPLEINVNNLLISPHEFLAACNNNGIMLAESSHLPGLFIIKEFNKTAEACATKESYKITDFLGFKEGWFFVQGESARIPALILDPKSGEDVLDLCAAPGGKSIQMAILMKNQGRILAVERKKERMEKLLENIKRCKAAIVEPVIEDARTLKPDKIGLFDKILVDAPCSGTGIIRKKVEIRWQKTLKDIKRHERLQMELLEAAINLLKHNGVLVYSTCSLESEENQDIITAFLSRHQNIVIDSLPTSCLHLAEQFKMFTYKEPFLHWQVFPFKDNMDGFFITRLRKVL